MAIADAIRRFAKRYDVSRPGGGSYVDGRWVAAAAEDLRITASVQPGNGKDLRLLEEGSRVSDVRIVITPDTLQTLDIVTIHGTGYQVQHVEPWEIGGFFRAVATRLAP